MAELSELAAIWAESTEADLSGLTNTEVSLSNPTVTNGDRERIIGARGKIVHTRCAPQDEACAELSFAAPLRAACALAAVQMGSPPGELESLEKGPFEGDVLKAYAEVMDLCAGILGRVLAEEAELPGVDRGDSAVLELPLGDGAPIEAGTYRRVRFDLKISGFPDETLDIVFPDSLAGSWFGAAPAPGGDGQDFGTIAVIAPSIDRDQIEDLVSELGCRMLAIEPAEIGGETLEDVAECAAVILSWDLGSCGGLDVLDWLRRDESTQALPIAMTAESPTREMVQCALHRGANTFLHEPYSADEIRTRMLEKA